ncbi:proprotein convertase subtilisin kexin type 7 [Limosa lapponica baueri]|uniref:Proprotein convertase subtilisin kexin type 7 n=1 Tax=Limosa lapponica baueri TaxID=1758121 RepID=A0A2I0TBG6_LIMLA|nr:proprotein convertase subtilisin kexin type 7 [Limosa lapponica baueri]
MEATLCIHTCLWLGAAWLPPALSDGLACGGERAAGTDARHGKLSWAVSLEAPEEELEQRAEELARTAGLVNMGRVGELKGHYLFTYQPDGHAASEPEAIRRSVDTLFAQHDSVRWHSEQKLLKRSKRSLHFNDPKYPQQWHLNNRKSPGKDINVTGVWEQNVTGRGVTVVVVDDGVEHTIKDIQPNYASGCWTGPSPIAWRPSPSTSTIRSMTSTAAAGVQMTMGRPWMAPINWER